MMKRKNECMKNSLKQLFRKKWMSILFFGIIMLSTVFFTLGCSLWMGVQDSINRMKDTFSTIGTVTQKPDSLIMKKTWDAALKKYKLIESSNYTQYIAPDILNDLEVEYIHPLERRPFFGAVSPDFVTSYDTNQEKRMTGSLMAFTPLKDCIPSEPVEVEVKDVYCVGEEASMMGKTIFFCDHYREETKPLEAGKTYIAFLLLNVLDRHSDMKDILEYYPLTISLSQDKTLCWEEMGTDFWNTDTGAMCQNLIDELNRMVCEAVPVTPTNHTGLLSPFHEGQATVVEGEDISSEEYENGSKVCLVPQTFAKLNHLEIGQKIKLQFYFTDYKYSTVQNVISDDGTWMFRTDILNKEGGKQDVFFESEYIIKGIYSRQSTGMDLYELFPDEFIIPSASVPEDQVSNIIAEGPMQGYNASFQIKNGGINDFYEEFSKLPEAALLEITFDDNGYEQFASQMNHLQTIAVIILLAGLVSVIASSAFLLYSAIIKERRRSAIERALGMSWGECRTSLLTGIILLAVLAAVSGGSIGGIANSMMLDKVSVEDEYFSSMYSRGIAASEKKEVFAAVNQEIVLKSVVLAVSAEVVGVFIMSLFLIRRNLKVNPIQLLGVREEE